MLPIRVPDIVVIHIQVQRIGLLCSPLRESEEYETTDIRQTNDPYVSDFCKLVDNRKCNIFCRRRNLCLVCTLAYMAQVFLELVLDKTDL